MPAASSQLVPHGILLCVTGHDPAAIGVTLQAVDDAPVAIAVCLDGGDADAVASWRGRIILEPLPISLGRTLCRNWLLALEPVRASSWVCFLDAGMIPPAGWLDLLFDAVAQYPDARSWGCREDADAPGGWLLAPDAPDERDITRLDGSAFSFAAMGGDACTPCMSMPSGCRLFRTDRLLEDGGWNLVFTPAWGADQERDLSIALKHGVLPCVCQEHLVIVPPMRNAAERRINAFKLAHRFTQDELATLHSLCQSPQSTPVTHGV